MITSTKKQLLEAIRLGMRPCSFCVLKRTEKCEIEPAKIAFAVASRTIPNLKKNHVAVCPNASIKENLIKMINCYFDPTSMDSSFSTIYAYQKNEYQKAIIENIRPCQTCPKKSINDCKSCADEDVQIDLLTIVDEVFKSERKMGGNDDE